MPTYEYICHDCQNKFDLYQHLSDDPKAVCPNCNSDNTERLLGTGSQVIFRGKGFYATDY